ncbi:hypothetical protein Acr_11g0012110 [Actinidia rufa]|uniref:Hydroxyproline O-arabinosyltransferase-like domain-containing protein n=1 Tax=Actinidia rufa TaxID=165716 RepID=A0A7J0FDZ0_9ERIC|nr:hypothetical protein Acr_11g0012110 [Actinidia rufa]
MGCGNFFFILVITFSVALITYNIIMSANAPLKSDFPGPYSNGFLSVDPIIKMPADRSKQAKKSFHTAVTSSDSVYNTWQCRIMYYWFKQHKGRPGSEMGGFTRILHSGKPDGFMDEIPTFVAQPLPNGMDQKLRPFSYRMRASWLVIHLNGGWEVSAMGVFLRWGGGSRRPAVDKIVVVVLLCWRGGGVEGQRSLELGEPLITLQGNAVKVEGGKLYTLVRINPLEFEVLLGSGYIVLNRPWAFVQWLQKADIKEDYILMSEPDHIIVKPIPNLSKDGLGAAFPFFYIEPKKYESVLRNFFPEDKGPITNIDPIGNSPVIVGKESLQKIAPTWMNVSLAMKKDPEADKKFGWVLEMYAYAVASALHGVGNILYKDFMIQPPWDKEIGNKFIIHYTYGCDYDMQGNLTYGKIGEWRFDKRSFEAVLPPKNLPLPPPGVPESVRYDIFGIT